MQSENKVNLKNKLSQKIDSLSLDKSELRKLFDLLQERSNGAADLELANFQKGQMQDDEFEKNKVKLREAFKLNLTVNGTKGEELFGPIQEVFSSPNFPEQANLIYVNSDNTLRAVYNYFPRNSFDLLLDFSKPSIFDLSLMPSERTPNNSKFTVQGYDVTWSNGVFNEIANFLKDRASPLSFVHKHSVYDVLLWVLGFPFAFWVSLNSSSVIERVSISVSAFFKNALYFYAFIIALFTFRLLFHYLRWVCPLVECRTEKAPIFVHRALLLALSGSVFGGFLYDIAKWFLQWVFK